MTTRRTVVESSMSVSAVVAGQASLRVGRRRVTAVGDGALAADHAVLVREDAARGHGHGPLAIPVVVHLIELDAGYALVDAGAGATGGPGCGRLTANLAALGVEPGDIRLILMTHLHPDHVGGLVEADGSAAYPNATLVVPDREAAFWLSDDVEGEPERTRRNRLVAKRTTAPYRKRLRLIGDEEATPGVSPVALPGHTPGHTGWLVQSEGTRLLLWGDIVHAAEIQVARPGTAVIYDVDPDEARRTRRAVLADTARDGLVIGGAHLPAPGFGRIRRSGTRYRYEPLALPAPSSGEREP